MTAEQEEHLVRMIADRETVIAQRERANAVDRAYVASAQWELALLRGQRTLALAEDRPPFWEDEG